MSGSSFSNCAAVFNTFPQCCFCIFLSVMSSKRQLDHRLNILHIRPPAASDSANCVALAASREPNSFTVLLAILHPLMFAGCPAYAAVAGLNPRTLA